MAMPEKSLRCTHMDVTAPMQTLPIVNKALVDTVCFGLGLAQGKDKGHQLNITNNNYITP